MMPMMLLHIHVQELVLLSIPTHASQATRATAGARLPSSGCLPGSTLIVIGSRRARLKHPARNKTLVKSRT